MPRKIGLRIAYDGSRFYGFQSQPGKATVESSLIAILRRIGAIEDARSGHYRASSRTDRGVGAIGNVVSVVTDMNPEKIARAINAMAKDIWCTGTAVLPDDLDVRHARSRSYACYVCDRGQKIPAMKKAAKCFIGEHDFTRYAKADGRNPIRRIKSIKIARRNQLIEFAVTGDSFLWNQIRRMVWALDQVGQGKSDPSQIRPESYSLSRVGLVPAENLILLAVDIGVEFEPVRFGDQAAEGVCRRVASSAVGASLYGRLLDMTGAVR